MTVPVRDVTRAARYAEKLRAGVSWLPLSLVTVEFHSDTNLGSAVRAAACFAVPTVHVIGAIPSRDDLSRLSGSTQDLIHIKQHSDPAAFLGWRRNNDPDSLLVSAELADDSVSLWGYRFHPAIHPAMTTYLAIGNETSGVPAEVVHNSDVVVHVPMPGPGFCMNAAASCNVFLAEASRQLGARVAHVG